MNSILLCLGSLINCRCSKKNDYFCCMEMLITKDQLHNTQSCMKLAMDERYLNDKKKKMSSQEIKIITILSKNIQNNQGHEFTKGWGNLIRIFSVRQPGLPFWYKTQRNVTYG